MLRTEETHPYRGLTVGEWGAANMRLLNHLLQENKLPRSQVEYYMAYTAHIMDMLETYEWDSILEFDYYYHDMQAKHGFVWGTDVPQLESKILMPRRPHEVCKPRQGPD